ncbi:MAG: ABC transporter permease [Bacteroidota bacterium]
MNNKKEQWTYIIKARSGGFNLGFAELWEFRDMISLFIKREYTSTYKQNILGPAWHFIQPVLSSLLYTFVFAFIAKISTQSVPPVLFYLTGLLPWGYFTECASRTSNIFVTNAHLFGKVYFPRLSVPIAVIISNLLKFFAQMILVFIVLFYYLFFVGNKVVHPNIFLLLIPILLLIMASLGMGMGIIISAMTTRYRDIANLTGFILQLIMYGSPILFPIDAWPLKLRCIPYTNPMTSIIETFRFAFLGAGLFNGMNLLYSFIFSIVLLFGGILLFNRTGKNFIDTV